MWLGNRSGTICFSSVLTSGQIIIYRLCTVVSNAAAYRLITSCLSLALYDDQTTRVGIAMPLRTEDYCHRCTIFFRIRNISGWPL